MHKEPFPAGGFVREAGLLLLRAAGFCVGDYCYLQTQPFVRRGAKRLIAIGFPQAPASQGRRGEDEEL